MYKLSNEDFLKLYRTEKSPRCRMRFLALHHLQQGNSKLDVCKMVCISRPTLNLWVLWYKKEGVERLRRKVKGRGIKPKISASKEELQGAILKLQEDRNGGRIVATDIQAMILDAYHVKYHKCHIYNILRKLGLSWISSRSKHPKSDPVAMDAFKKTSAKIS